jgi:hypothetical protein
MNRWVVFFSRLVLHFPWFAKFILWGRRVIRRASISLKKARAVLVGTLISDAEFQRSLRREFSSQNDFLAVFTAQQGRKFFIQDSYKEETLHSLRQICPGAESLIIEAADKVCEHYFDLLGSGPTLLGWPMDWHTDFKSGFRWDPRQYYAEMEPAPFPGGHDIKAPWELSRCQHFIWLGQAYWLTGDEKYAGEFRAEVEDWIKQNQPEYGVNWSCSMDIAIRAVNWLWGYAFFQSSPVLDDNFRLSLCKSLLSHGRHIRANLERTVTFAGNHYLSDIVGLIYLGFLLPELKEAQDWREFGLKELEREMFKQVYRDGGDFEASTSYHRLATELFLSATLLAELNGYRFGDVYLNRLEKMLDFIFQITKPDGTVPIIGDQDNGRLHRLKIWANPPDEWKDFRPILAIGSIFFDREDWGRESLDHWEEAIWFYGKKAMTSFRGISELSPPQKKSTGLVETGIYVLRADDMYAVVDLGSIGQNGRGGHAHNDSLSFELFSFGSTWIQDPGTFLYTSDYESRHMFRSTLYHNTIVFPPHEQNGLEPTLPFRMAAASTCRVLKWIPGHDQAIYLLGELYKHHGYTHIRSFFLDQKERALVITDSAIGKAPMGKFVLHIAPGVQLSPVEEPYPGLRLVNASNDAAWLFPVSAESARFHISAGWVSSCYGHREAADIVSLEDVGLPLKTIILLPGTDEQISPRVENSLRNESIFLERYG